MVKVILLNGVGSAGKSSIAKALQLIVERPFLHVEMDGFLEMMPEKYLDHNDGLCFETNVDQGVVETKVNTGKVAKRVLDGMRRSVVALAEAGNNLIVDEVIFGTNNNGSSNPFAEYQTLLKPFDLQWVGVFACLDVLEKRERERDDRKMGLARWQYDRVHDEMNYDFCVNTDKLSPLECAELIKIELNL